MKKERILAVLILVIMICTCIMPDVTCDAYYEKLDGVRVYTFASLQTKYFVDKTQYDYTGSCAYLAPNGHMYVPLNMLSEAFSSPVAFEEDTQTVSATIKSVVFVQEIDEPFIFVNGVKYDDVPPYINENNEVMVPVDVYVGALGLSVNFEYPEWCPKGVCYIETSVEITSLSRIFVNKHMQMVTIYGQTSYGQEYPVRNFMCSTGIQSYRTPNGTFRVKKLSYGRGYGRWYWFKNPAVWVINCSQITGNVCFHSTSFKRFNDINSLYTPSYTNLGSPASAGCIRLTVQDAQFIWDNCNGIAVTISDGYYSEELQDIKNGIIKNKPSVSNYKESVDYVVIK